MGTIRPQIVLFGDSITELSFQVAQTGFGALLAHHYTRKTGFGALLAHHYTRKADVLNRGFGGYNSRFAQYLLDQIFPIPSSNPPILVTVFFGANDSAIPNAAHSFLHVPLKEYAQNLHKIIAHIKNQSASTRIVLITPPPIYEKNLVIFSANFGDFSGVPPRRNEFTRLYADECVKVAKATNVSVIDISSIFQKAPGWQEKYLSDGLHLSAEGNVKLFEELLKILDHPDFVPTLKSNRMPWDYPMVLHLGADPLATLKSWSIPYLKRSSGKTTAHQ